MLITCIVIVGATALFCGMAGWLFHNYEDYSEYFRSLKK